MMAYDDETAYNSRGTDTDESRYRVGAVTEVD
jgi:hypothetical protein